MICPNCSLEFVSTDGQKPTQVMTCPRCFTKIYPEKAPEYCSYCDEKLPAPDDDNPLGVLVCPKCFVRVWAFTEREKLEEELRELKRREEIEKNPPPPMCYRPPPPREPT